MKSITVSGITFQVDQLHDNVPPQTEIMAAIRAANEAISGQNGNPTIGHVGSRDSLVVVVEPDEDELQDQDEEFDGTEGQDRSSYSDDQDRESYSVSDGLGRHL
jgi:hypothetical protein